jgi:DNA-binding transcriptional MocR family regulator
VAIESPACFDVLQCLESLGLKALEIPTHPQEGISLDALRFALDHNKIAACLASPNFNNPLGSCMSDENKRGLVELLGESGVPLIENDIFGELHFGDKRPLAAKAFDRHDNVLLCSSVSKCLAPGFRVGWVAAGKLQSSIEWLKYASSMANTTHTSYAVAEFMASGGYLRHLRRIRRILNRNLNAMRGAVIRYFPSDIQVTRPSGGFLLWVRLPGKVDSLVFYKQALKRGIAITPGYIYSPTDRFRNFIRLNTAFWSEATEDAVRRLGRLTAEMS